MDGNDSDFLRGYWDALVFTGRWYSSSDRDNPTSLKRHLAGRDLSRPPFCNVISEIVVEAMHFYNAHSNFLRGREYQAGIEFHLSRRGKGGGFSDRDWHDEGPALDLAAKLYGRAEIEMDSEGSMWVTRG